MKKNLILTFLTLFHISCSYNGDNKWSNENKRSLNSILLSPKFIVMSNSSGKVLEKHSILIVGPLIKEIGPSDVLQKKYPYIRSIITNSIISPGFINTHTHLANTHMRPKNNDKGKYRSVKEWFKATLKDENLSSGKEVVLNSAIIGSVEQISQGVTTVNDMSFYSNQVKIALQKVGVEGLTGETLLNEKNIHYTNSKEALSIVTNSIINNENTTIAPLTIASVQEKQLKKILELANEHQLLIHTHWGEFPSRLNNKTISILTNSRNYKLNFLLAHGIHLDPTLKNLILNHEVSISLNISSNDFLNAGVIDLTFYKNNNVNMSIGTDSPITNKHMSFFHELRSILKIKSFAQNHYTYKDLFSWATLGGAKALKLNQSIGTVEVGKKANLLSIKISEDQKVLSNTVYEYLVTKGDRNLIDYVMIKGDLKVTNGELNKNIQDHYAEAMKFIKNQN